MTASLRRSLLYVPALNDRAVDKARALDCDAVILDLEDSVPVEAKDSARSAAVAAIRQGFPGRTVALRINPAGSPAWEADVRAAVAARPDVVVLPKVASPEAVLSVARGLGEDTELWAMIESCQAVLRLADIAAVARTTSLRALLVGTNDLTADLRCRDSVGREALAPVLSQIAVAARAFGLAPLDGPFNDFGDMGGLEVQCRQAAELGYDGKSLIHPSQIEAANRAFSPPAERIHWARAVIAAFDQHPKAAVIAINGRMVERAMHLKEALAIAAFAMRTEP